jgi:hypothetical protein
LKMLMAEGKYNISAPIPYVRWIPWLRW